MSLIVTSVIYVRSREQQSAQRVKMKPIVASATSLQPGVPLTAENLTLIQWPENVPLDGAIAKPEDVVGRVLLYPVGPKEPLMQRELAAPGNIGLTAKIPDGMRAAAVKTNEVTNVAGFLFPGCKVDVLVSLRREGNTTLTRTVLQNVQVLSTGTKTAADPEGKPENVSVVTLLVTPEESENLVWAQQQGTIQFVLRNGNDQKKSEIPVVTLAELTGAKPAPVAASPRPRKPRAPAAYEVETLAGNKTTVAKFEAKSE